MSFSKKSPGSPPSPPSPPSPTGVSQFYSSQPTQEFLQESTPKNTIYHYKVTLNPKTHPNLTEEERKKIIDHATIISIVLLSSIRPNLKDKPQSFNTSSPPNGEVVDNTLTRLISSITEEENSGTVPNGSASSEIPQNNSVDSHTKKALKKIVRICTIENMQNILQTGLNITDSTVTTFEEYKNLVQRYLGNFVFNIFNLLYAAGRVTVDATVSIAQYSHDNLSHYLTSINTFLNSYPNIKIAFGFMCACLFVCALCRAIIEYIDIIAPVRKPSLQRFISTGVSYLCEAAGTTGNFFILGENGFRRLGQSARDWRTQMEAANLQTEVFRITLMSVASWAMAASAICAVLSLVAPLIPNPRIVLGQVIRGQQQEDPDEEETMTEASGGAVPAGAAERAGQSEQHRGRTQAPSEPRQNINRRSRSRERRQNGQPTGGSGRTSRPPTAGRRAP